MYNVHFSEREDGNLEGAMMNLNSNSNLKPNQNVTYLQQLRQIMEQKSNKYQTISRKESGKFTYFPHSAGGFHADKIISDLALGRQFLKTKYFVVN